MKAYFHLRKFHLLSKSKVTIHLIERKEFYLYNTITIYNNYT